MRIPIPSAVLVVVLLAGWSLAARCGYSHDRAVAERKTAAARRQFAFESLEQRLPAGRPIPPAKPPGPEAQKRWEILDRNVASYQDRRAELLRDLHETTRTFFVKSPGAGPTRLKVTPEMVLTDDGWVRTGTPAQPGAPADFPASPGEPLTTLEPDYEFHFHHGGAMFDFLYPTDFGYVKDRAHVAGFKPHGFRYLGVPVAEVWRWRVRHIRLVGILTQAEPVVYLTDGLPSMEQVRQDKTRRLDIFEEAGLTALRDGDDLFIARKDDEVRMLGALRATPNCLQCHDANPGDLLGAFSYTLWPAEAARAAGEQP